ncbi:MAG: biotin--[acetyl-CoA-carboxylase] ligase [Candidatus Omnitrophica bacterium]|nr:biotin--[acetyl-CoA-carboxylase] ligase [Candidatus Omnitrophota bacterium]
MRRDAELEERLFHALKATALGRPCYAFGSLPSTMDVAHQLAQAGTEEGSCVWAERQTAGRGRSGREWSSPSGGVYLSLILRPARGAVEVPQLALVTGLAAARAIHDLTGLAVAIRWPNDVLIDGKKVVGILAESATDQAGRRYVVIGIGINVATPVSELPAEAGSLAHGATPPPSRFSVAAACLRHLERLYGQWAVDGFAAVRPQFVQWSGLFGRLVKVTTGQGTLEGQTLDIDEAGRLLVRLDSGLVRAFEAAEIRLLR